MIRLFSYFRRLGMERPYVAEMRQARENTGGNWTENGASPNNSRTPRTIRVITRLLFENCINQTKRHQ